MVTCTDFFLGGGGGGGGGGGEGGEGTCCCLPTSQSGKQCLLTMFWKLCKTITPGEKS